MYIYVRASMLKDLYRRLRAKDRKIEYLNLVIEHLRNKEPEEEELCIGLGDIFSGFEF